MDVHLTSGLLYVEWYESRGPGARPLARTKNLGHSDRERGKADAYDLAAKLLRGEVERKEAATPAADGPLTLGAVFQLYLAEVTPGKKTAPHDERASKLFLALWGPDRVIRSLSARDWQQFIRLRRSGELAPDRGKEESSTTRKPVRDRVVEQDLKFLRAVLNWATRLKDPKGDFRLPVDPLRGLKIPKEQNPVRTVLREADYAKLLEVAPGIGPRLHLALVLCGETGHRLASVRMLRWTDIDLTAGVVTWPAEHDKIENEHQTPLSDAALAVLKAERTRQGAIAGWVFPGQSGEQPLDRGRFYGWWKTACTRAEITRPKGAFHTLRRKFATERVGVPLKTLASLGGWKDTRTIVECYRTPTWDSSARRSRCRNGGWRARESRPIPTNNPDQHPFT
jgi:integrase